MRADRKFFDQNPVIVARELIGSHFINTTPDGEIIGKIIETEAYGDETDLASHARFGKTNRSMIMYDKPGILYIYTCYGIFNLTNIICGPNNVPGAVLIRSAEILLGENLVKKNLGHSKFVKINAKLATGPGKFSLAFGITKNDNFKDITRPTSHIHIDINGAPSDIIESTRIGVEYAKDSKNWPWRFYQKNNKLVSKK